MLEYGLTSFWVLTEPTLETKTPEKTQGRTLSPFPGVHR